jgi:2-methylcitrate dehydratase PrpD
MAAQTIDPSEVQEIQVRAFYEAVVSLGVWRPQYVVDAMFSLPHLIALVLLGKSPSRGLDEADLSDSEVRALEAKVARLELDPEADRAYGMNQHEMPSTVTITMRNGRSYTARVVHPRGDPENPLSDEELQAKFRQLVVPVLGPEKTERIVKRVRELESLDDVSKLML